VPALCLGSLLAGSTSCRCRHDNGDPGRDRLHIVVDSAGCVGLPVERAHGAEAVKPAGESEKGVHSVYIAIGISGLTALAAR